MGGRIRKRSESREMSMTTIIKNGEEYVKRQVINLNTSEGKIKAMVRDLV